MTANADKNICPEISDISPLGSGIPTSGGVIEELRSVKVTIGSRLCTNPQIINNGYGFNCSAPAGVSRLQNLIISDGTGKCSAFFPFRYAGPTIEKISRVRVEGGRVSVSGKNFGDSSKGICPIKSLSGLIITDIVVFANGKPCLDVVIEKPHTSISCIFTNGTGTADFYLMVGGQTKYYDFTYDNRIFFNISGHIRNALNNSPLGDSRVTFTLNGQNETTNSTSDGAYSIYLPTGVYNVIVERDGFISVVQSLNITGNVSSGLSDVVMSPVLSSDTYRIVLVWNADPKDLDAHLTLDGCEVNYQNKFCRQANSNATLDIDDQEGHGPETVSVYGA
ncbi:hypothetical protein PROFUN_01226 [Planoprotostelium fungivorum]|uniref:Uncharacterized protein n=1 Tax=Planoprotostelium fungivorum TaxID=1890364 RepID=A0A2P6NZG4_9EUKA|nr:hypothetical protein PROFUN_01226 [Planoprotostelium fungivorum]